MSLKKELSDLIASDKVKEALEKLRSYAESTGQDDLYNTTTHLSGRYFRNENNHNKGILTNENYNLMLNRITYALKETIDSELVIADPSIEDDKIEIPERGGSEDGKKSVFISYSHSEAEYAKKVQLALEKLNVNVIIDEKGLSAGQDIKSFIEKSIAQSSNTISIISSKSLHSSWISNEIIKTIQSENIANKKFIAAFIDDSFFDRGFTNDALDKIELEINDIHKEMDERRSKNRNIDDLYSELSRYSDLKHNLPAIIQRLKESYSVDIRDSVFEEGIKKIYDALI